MSGNPQAINQAPSQSGSTGSRIKHRAVDTEERKPIEVTGVENARLQPQVQLNFRNIYLWLISLIGFVLVGWGLFLLPGLDSLFVFLLLFLLAIAAQAVSTMLVGGHVIVEVGTAVSMAAVALYGPQAACLIAAAGVTTGTLLNLQTNWKGWPAAAERIGFNVGMSAIAIFLAGLVFQGIAATFSFSSIAVLVLAWIVASVVNDQTNLWLLIGLLHLQSGAKPLHIWQQHKWAIPINVVVMSIGGGVLAFAVQEFNIIGIGIFFLPIALSAYSFRLYVNQTKKQMINLEELVAERTGELARANEELARANKELSTLSKEKDDFLAVLTHDMRTPLTSIKGYASILRDRDLEPEKHKQIAKIILRSEEALLEIVNNILEIEKMQSGTPILLERASFDLALLAKGVTETLQAQAMEKNITLHYDEVPSPIMIEADVKKIERVITNLISNAIKYTPDGGEVWVRARAKGRYAQFAVKDNGYGIPAAELPFIFDRYSRVKGHRSLAVGTGLGLAVVKSLIEAHGGHITVKSVEDKGSIFTVILPIR